MAFLTELLSPSDLFPFCPPLFLAAPRAFSLASEHITVFFRIQALAHAPPSPRIVLFFFVFQVSACTSPFQGGLP